MFFKRAESIRKRLNKLEKLEKPKEKENIPLKFTSERGSKIVLRLDNINISYPDKVILKNAKIQINYQEKVCLIGPNGCGKSSLIKYILKNSSHKCGYIPQHIEFTNDNNTVLEEAKNYWIGEEANLRSALNKFYFFKDNILKRIKNLSGGEKVRLKLFCLMQENNDFLILDEPTNHIDIKTKEILENALNDYNGTILFISHDRYFINELATKIIYFENESLKVTPGNYDDYKRVKTK